MNTVMHCIRDKKLNKLDRDSHSLSASGRVPSSNDRRELTRLPLHSSEDETFCVITVVCDVRMFSDLDSTPN